MERENVEFYKSENKVWMFTRKLLFKSSMQLDGKRGVQVRSQITAKTFAFSSVMYPSSMNPMQHNYCPDPGHNKLALIIPVDYSMYTVLYSVQFSMAFIWHIQASTCCLTTVSKAVFFIKGQCHEIFNTFLNKKPPGLHMNRQKRFCEFFRFREDIREKGVYEDTVSALSMTKLTHGK